MGKHRFRNWNDIMSTTLLPREQSPVSVRLFTEYGGAVLGMFLNPSYVSHEDFGRSYHMNGGTAGSGFRDHRKPTSGGYKSSIAGRHVLPQKELFDFYEAQAREGVPLSAFTYPRLEVHSGEDRNDCG